MKLPLDNPVLDIPEVGINSKFYKAKSAKVKTVATADDKLPTTEPSSPNMADPAYNHVKKTLSGHVQEWDDTPGAERIVIGHANGHYFEMSPDGRTTKIFGKDFQIVLDDHTLFVGGNLNITVEGNANLLVKGDMNQKIGGNYSLKVGGNIEVFAKEDINFRSNNSHFETVLNTTIKAGSRFVAWAKTLIAMDAARIDFNKPTKKPASKNIKYGLELTTSLIEPSVNDLYLNKSDVPAALDLRDDETTYPKDRR